jgi:hypothetical protein
MKKQILKNVLIASFALSGLFIVGSNVSASNNDNTEDSISTLCASIYNVDYKVSIFPPSIGIKCTTGGSRKCPLFKALCNW